MLPVRVVVPVREATPRDAARPSTAEIIIAVAAFAVLCLVVLRTAPQLPEPDDYAYRASIVGITDGHLLTLSAAQVRGLAEQLLSPPSAGRAVSFRPGLLGGAVEQWVRLPDGRWISEKDPGYPFLAAPFQLLGIIRVAPLFYGALGCLGLFFGARRWLGPFGGAVAVGLFCTSGGGDAVRLARLHAHVRRGRPDRRGSGRASVDTARGRGLRAAAYLDRAAGIPGTQGRDVQPVHECRGARLRRAGRAGRALAAAAGAAAAGARVVARVCHPVRGGGGRVQRPCLRRAAEIRIPARRDQVRPRRRPAEPPVYARAPESSAPSR